jgi:hypothetical protein
MQTIAAGMRLVSPTLAVSNNFSFGLEFGLTR